MTTQAAFFLSLSSKVNSFPSLLFIARRRIHDAGHGARPPGVVRRPASQGPWDRLVSGVDSNASPLKMAEAHSGAGGGGRCRLQLEFTRQTDRRWMFYLFRGRLITSSDNCVTLGKRAEHFWAIYLPLFWCIQSWTDLPEWPIEFDAIDWDITAIPDGIWLRFPPVRGALQNTHLSQCACVDPNWCHAFN